jgi:hypothetical protein
LTAVPDPGKLFPTSAVFLQGDERLKLIGIPGVLLVVMLIFFCCSFSEASSFPYELSIYREAILGTAGLSAIGISMYLARYMEIPNTQDISDLEKSDINRLDRSAVGYLIPFMHEERNEDFTVMALMGEKRGLAVGIRF